MFIIGLQEMVSLKVIGSILCNKDLERMSIWEKIFKAGLDKRMAGLNFTCIAKKVMFGCFLMIFAQ